jgi:hypothetical protein
VEFALGPLRGVHSVVFPIQRQLSSFRVGPVRSELEQLSRYQPAQSRTPGPHG